MNKWFITLVTVISISAADARSQALDPGKLAMVTSEQGGSKIEQAGGTSGHVADTVIARYREYLLRTVEPLLPGVMNNWPAINADGSWPDVNYQDQSMGIWKALVHIKRVRILAQHLAGGDDRNSNIFHMALGYWLKHKFTNPNWWHNEIGIPQLLRDILAFVSERLSPQEYQSALSILGQANVRPDATGANLVWSADLVLHHAAFINDTVTMRSCRDMIVNTVRITTEEGIQPDYSFLQHGPRLQMYQYGKALLRESVRVGWQLRGTTMAMPMAKVAILNDFLLEGWIWMARGVNTAPGTIDRSVTRVDELRSADIRTLVPFLKELSPVVANQLQLIADVQNHKRVLQGFRHFPYADFTVYHTPGYSFFLKTISTRTLPTESINQENLLGKWLGTGDGYVISNGNEYHNLMPVLDWNALPGTISFPGAASLRRSSFSGSVGDDQSGITVMDTRISSVDMVKRLNLRRFWAMNNGVVVQLVAAADSSAGVDSFTIAIEQSRLQSAVTVNGRPDLKARRKRNVSSLTSVSHNSTTYRFDKPVKGMIYHGPVSGNWKRVDGAASAESISDSVFKFEVLVPSKKPVQLSWSISSTAQLKKTMGIPAYSILVNNSQHQAVRFSNGHVMIAFYKAGVVKNGLHSYKADQPCLVFVDESRLMIADPAQTGRQFNISINNKNYQVTLPAIGKTVSVPLKI